jgi:hypothetical protein
MNTGKTAVPPDRLDRHIHFVRGQRVMLSLHLAGLYGVAPRVLVQAVKRNPERFPPDFMFQLDVQEFENLKSQIVTSSWGGLRRAAPCAFTKQGVAPGAVFLFQPVGVPTLWTLLRRQWITENENPVASPGKEFLPLNVRFFYRIRINIQGLRGGF